MNGSAPSALRFPESFTFVADEVSQDPKVVAAFARRHGFSGIELRSMFGRQFRELTRNDIAEIALVLSDHGLMVHGCATPVFKCALENEAAVHEHRDILRRSVEIAGALQCPLLRVFTFLRRNTPTAADDLRAAADRVGNLLDLVPAAQRLGVENEASCLMGTVAEVREFFQGARNPRLGLIWDPCNVLYVPGYRGPATESFASLVPHLWHIHAKDAARTIQSATAQKIGDGEVGWSAHFAEIARSGYRGLISLETHWRMQALDDATLHLPGGFQFSAGGEVASEACVAAIRDMFRPAIASGAT